MASPSGSCAWVAALATTCSLCAACADAPGIDALDVATGAERSAIINGGDDVLHPSVVALLKSDGGGECTGTVIGARHILTAAHCVADTASVAFLANVRPCVGVGCASVPVVGRATHPEYDGGVHRDVGVITIGSDAPVGALPVLLDETLGSDDIGGDALAVGFGMTAAEQPQTAGIRRAVSFRFGGFGSEVGVGDDAILADGSATCSGDSGGPALVVRNGVEHVAAVSSFVVGSCGQAGFARTDASVATFIASASDEGGCAADGACTCAGTGALVTDSDCAVDSCGADGTCSPGCLLPLDVDCGAPPIDRCGGDGACDTSCLATDPDCATLCGADGNCLDICPSPDPDCSAGEGEGEGEGEGDGGSEGEGEGEGEDGGEGEGSTSGGFPVRAVGCGAQGASTSMLAVLAALLRVRRRARADSCACCRASYCASYCASTSMP